MQKYSASTVIILVVTCVGRSKAPPRLYFPVMSCLYFTTNKVQSRSQARGIGGSLNSCWWSIDITVEVWEGQNVERTHMSSLLSPQSPRNVLATLYDQLIDSLPCIYYPNPSSSSLLFDYNSPVFLYILYTQRPRVWL